MYAARNFRLGIFSFVVASLKRASSILALTSSLENSERSGSEKSTEFENCPESTRPITTRDSMGLSTLTKNPLRSFRITS